jgi:signal recognition particle subunit SRP54
LLESLSDKLGAVFRKLAGRGALSEENIAEALREVRVALLEADVALPVVKDFLARVKARAVGQEVMASITPAQQVVKIVHDELKDVLGAANVPLAISANPPTIILMAGLQGSGKTTTTAKLAKRLKDGERKKVLLASADVYRPAAQQQLEILAGQIGVGALPIVAGQQPLAIAERALHTARAEGYDVVFIDTAGRTTIDAAMMDEIKALAAATNPHEILLVLDAMTGQDAVNTATAFHAALPLTGTVLTRIDGDARGGAALSLRHVTGQPIKFLATGEKLDAIEPFHPDRLAGRILGMGDVVSLVESAIGKIDQAEAAAMAAKLNDGKFDLDDLAAQLTQMQKMGGLGGIMSFLPGAGALKDAMKSANVDDRILARQKAIISSMTKAERRNPDVLNASRKRRVAAGAGTKVEDINRLLKQYLGMRDMMRQMKRGGAKGMLRQFGGLMGGRGLGDLQALQQQLKKGE